jgi:hypothetical protein
MTLLYVVVLGIAFIKFNVSSWRSKKYSKREGSLEAPGVVENDVEIEDTSGNASVNGARESVHYNPTDPYHPLRMHPINSLSTIRSVAPDIMEDNLKAVESSGQIPTASVPTPAVYQPLTPPVYSPTP